MLGLFVLFMMNYFLEDLLIYCPNVLYSSLAESFVSNITKLFLHGDVEHLSSYRDAIQFKALPLQVC